MGMLPVVILLSEYILHLLHGLVVTSENHTGIKRIKAVLSFLFRALWQTKLTWEDILLLPNRINRNSVCAKKKVA